nr:hypothetical protein [Planococcus glaciei]
MTAIFHFSFASLLIGLGSGLVVPYLNLYFSNRFEASNTYIGLILALGSAMTVVATLIGPLLVNKVGKVKAMLLFQLLSIPFLILTAYTTSLLLASLGFFIAASFDECRKSDSKCDCNGSGPRQIQRPCQFG